MQISVPISPSGVARDLGGSGLKDPTPGGTILCLSTVSRRPFQSYFNNNSCPETVIARKLRNLHIVVYPVVHIYFTPVPFQKPLTKL